MYRLQFRPRGSESHFTTLPNVCDSYEEAESMIDGHYGEWGNIYEFRIWSAAS